MLGDASRVLAEPPVIVPCDPLPAAVAALGLKSTIDSYGIASGASVAVAATASPGEEERSDFWIARGGEEPRAVKLAGRALGIAVTSDGNLAYAVVRVTDRKGAVRRVDLVCVDLKTARAASCATLPATARGLAIGDGGATLLLASRDEIRTFHLPDLASGRMYRALGDNVGVARVAGSSTVLIAQPSRVVLADLAGTQGRDGLLLSQETAAPAPLTGMVSSTTDGIAIVLSDGGAAWCVRVKAAPPPPTEPRRSPAQVAPAEPAPAPAPPPVEAPAEAPAEIAPPPEVPVPPPIPAAPEIPTAAGTVFGVIEGPALAEVAAVVFLGPDNVLHEAARVSPDDRGRFRASALPIGAYRIVAAGKGGRVLMCEPSFITIRVGSDSAVEAPVLKVLRAQ